MNAVAKHLGLLPCFLTRQLTQQDFQIEDGIAIAVREDHSYSQTMEVVLELGFERVTDQNVFLVCPAHDSVTAFVLSLAVILVQETVDQA